jgi:hypothetical protein
VAGKRYNVVDNDVVRFVSSLPALTEVLRHDNTAARHRTIPDYRQDEEKGSCEHICVHCGYSNGDNSVKTLSYPLSEAALVALGVEGSDVATPSNSLLQPATRCFNV